MTPTQPIHTENTSPKKKFQDSGTRLSDHRSMVASDIFRMAVDTALLQYQLDLTSKCTDMNYAARIGMCMLGAQELVTVLRGLADKPTFAPKVVNDNLVPA